MTFAEVVEFAKDFGVDRALATKTELFTCFRACRRNPLHNMLSYPEFVECLARVALLSFSKPYLDKNHPKPEHKIHGFFGWCRASDGLKRIGAIEWSRGHSRAGLQLTKVSALFTDGQCHFCLLFPVLCSLFFVLCPLSSVLKV